MGVPRGLGEGALEDDVFLGVECTSRVVGGFQCLLGPRVGCGSGGVGDDDYGVRGLEVRPGVCKNGVDGVEWEGVARTCECVVHLWPEPHGVHGVKAVPSGESNRGGED